MCCPRTAAGEGFDAGTGGDANGKGAVARVVKVMPDGDSDCGPQRTGLLAVPTRYCRPLYTSDVDDESGG